MPSQSSVEPMREDRLSGTLPAAERQPGSWLTLLAAHAMAHIVLAPLVLFLGAVLFAGVIGLAGKIDQLRGGRGHGAELWPCFPAALALVLIAGGLYRFFRNVRRRTIREFEYVDGMLRYRGGDLDEWIAQRTSNIRSVGECPGVRGATRIRFGDRSWAVVASGTGDAEALLERIDRDRKHPAAGQIKGQPVGVDSHPLQTRGA